MHEAALEEAVRSMASTIAGLAPLTMRAAKLAIDGAEGAAERVPLLKRRRASMRRGRSRSSRHAGRQQGGRS